MATLTLLGIFVAFADLKILYYCKISHYRVLHQIKSHQEFHLDRRHCKNS